MEELKDILIVHAALYPLMQPTDAVKLVYQNEFGGGHMIRDAQAFYDYLHREYAAVTKDMDAPLYEDIGNGMIRVNLAAVAETDLDRLGAAFIRSAQLHTGDLQSFKRKIALLHELTESGALPFSLPELEAYMSAYEKAGYPMVSHSAQYRSAYKPAYRVIMISK